MKVDKTATSERGDLVAMRDGDATPTRMNLLAVDNKVIQVVAKSDTMRANLFGIPNNAAAKPYSLAMWLNPAH